MARDDVESNLTFLGLLVMENKMKDVTKGVIDTLTECEVKTIMATGDNVLIAISVAGQCGIVNKEDNGFLGELSYHEQTQEPFVIWTNQEKQNGSIAANDVSRSSDISSANGDDEQTGLPWDFNAEKISVALTGKAFKHIYERRE